MLKKVLTIALGIILVIFGLVVSAVMIPVGYVHWDPLTTLEKALQTTAANGPTAPSAERETPNETVRPVVTVDGTTEKIDFLLTDPAENPGWWAEAAQKGLSAAGLPKVLLGWNSSGSSSTNSSQGGGGLLLSSLAAPSSLASSAAYAALSGTDDEGGAPGKGPQGTMDPVNNAIPYYSEPTVTTPTSPTPAVPEPSTLSLMALVGIGLVVLSRCRKVING